MSDFELNVSGIESFREDLNDLEGDLTTDEEYVVGVGAEYGIYLEFGTRKMPPYPFFRPAIREARANPDEFVDSEAVDSITEYIRKLAFSLEAQIKINATAETSGRSPGTDSDHPQVDTGNLRASIEARRT